MSKLFKYKVWVTLDEAANYLSIVLAEKVGISDVLRLALDGYLKLSVNFVNHAQARKGNRLLYKDAEKVEMPSLKGDSNVLIVCGLKFINQETGIVEEVVQFDEKVITVDGIWDLTMIGGERLDVEHKFQMLTNGPSIELVNYDGCYIEDYSNGTVYELQESFDSNQYTKGSTAQLEEIKSQIVIKNIPKDKAELLIQKHKEDRKEFLENARKKDNTSSNYYPIGGLPDNSVLVVRTKAISEFIETIATDKKIDKPLSDKERETLLVIIAALAKEAKVDITKISKAGDNIADMTQKMGVDIGATTIETHLKKIPQALQSRAK